jgi:hypothetical protein
MSINTVEFDYHRWPLVSQKLSYFLNKVAIDNSFNRYACWNKTSSTQYMRNVLVGFAPTPIIIANLRKCLDLCIEGSEEYKYFNSWIEKGYEYLAIDGNNRTISIRDYLNSKISIPHGILTLSNARPIEIDKTNAYFQDHPIELREYIEKEVMVTICEYALSTREQVTQLFYDVNEGKPLKDQEKRNALLVDMAKETRNISKKYEKGNKFFKNNKHYVFDELMVKCAVIFAFGPSNGVTQKDMYKAYTDNSIVYNALVRRSAVNGRQLIEYANKLVQFYNGEKINASTFINLFIALCNINEDGNKVDNDEKFFNWFMETESKRLGSKSILHTNEKGDYTYSMLCGATGKVDLRCRSEAIQKDLNKCPYVTLQVEKDPNRIFSKTQRYEAWEKQGGKTPAGDIIPESEIYDTEKWHADHVVAFSRGGSTTVDNCVLISKEDNLRKGNRSI